MIILLRHGRTALNAARRLQGRIDEPLDEVGLAQAASAAARIGPVDELIASPLIRAQQTAEAFGQTFETDERWIELSYGIYDGQPFGDVPSEAWKQWMLDPTFEPPEGESLLTLDQRVRGACDDLVERARDRTVVVVTHVSPIKAAVGWALGGGVEMAWRSHLDPGAICRIEIGRQHPILHTFNETAH